MQLSLARFAYLPNMTLGFLTVAGLRFATLEEPWLANPAGPGGIPLTPGVMPSCVPDGAYILEPHNTKAHPNVWALVNEVLGVYHWTCPSGQKWGRAACLIHNGNTTRDTDGCIIAGMRHGSQGPQQSIDEVVESRNAIIALQGILKQDTHRLTVGPYQGTIDPLWGTA